MQQNIESILTSLGLTLPTPAAPVANYLPFVVENGLVFLAGQLPMQDGKVVFTGTASQDTLEEARKAAQLCALNIVAQLKVVCQGDFSRIARCVRLVGFVASGADFYQQPQVINAASELLVQLFGENGRHARAAVGCNVLPLNAMVEIDAIFALK